tara:strand:+ start:477 stop:806 length:330 start_codon:yes stop_codon:yes gene_type:complete
LGLIAGADRYLVGAHNPGVVGSTPIPATKLNIKNIMKANLEFNLPEDEEQFNAAAKAMDWALLAWDIDQLCRDWIKYDNHNFESVEEVLQAVRDHIYEAMAEKGVQFPN